MERYETLFAQLKNRQGRRLRPLCHPWRSGTGAVAENYRCADRRRRRCPVNWGSLLRPAGGRPDHPGRGPARLRRGRVTPAQCFGDAGGDPPEASDHPNRPADVCQPRLQPGHRCVLCPVRPRRRRLGAGGRRAGGRVRPVPPGGDAP